MKLKYDYSNKAPSTTNSNTTYIDMQKTLNNTINKTSQEYKSGSMGGSNVNALTSGGSWNTNEE
jgi:hypothetical protein